MITKTLDLNNIERKVFWILVSFIGVAVAFYTYSVLLLTIAGVDRDYLSRTAHEINTKVGNLEEEYLIQSNSITFARAEYLGFHEVSVKFADVSQSKISLAR